jgi:hypothetical protein
MEELDKLLGARGSGSAKDTKRYLVQAIRDALVGAGRDASDVDALIASEAGGYRLTVPCFVR